MCRSLLSPHQPLEHWHCAGLATQVHQRSFQPGRQRAYERQLQSASSGVMEVMEKGMEVVGLVVLEKVVREEMVEEAVVAVKDMVVLQTALL